MTEPPTLAPDEHLIPKRGIEPTRCELRRLGRGIAYTRPAAMYVFERVTG